jgi:hypothetical protein
MQELFCLTNKGGEKEARKEEQETRKETRKEKQETRNKKQEEGIYTNP